IAPVVEFVGVFDPAVADVGAVVHIGNEDVTDACVNLCLRLLHGGASTDNDKDNAGCACNEPLAVDFFNVFDVNTFLGRLFENDRAVFGEGFKGGVVVKRKRRNDDTDADLKAAARTPLRFLTVGELPEQIADRSQHAFLLDADGGIAKTRSKFERVDTVVIYDAVQIDVSDIALLGELRFHL